MAEGWGQAAAFPAIETLPVEQRSQLAFVMIPPSITLVFAPGAVAYTLVSPIGPEATLASSDRVTAGGWLLPRTTLDLPDFDRGTALVEQGGEDLGTGQRVAAGGLPPGGRWHRVTRSDRRRCGTTKHCLITACGPACSRHRLVMAHVCAHTPWHELQIDNGRRAARPRPNSAYGTRRQDRRTSGSSWAGQSEPPIAAHAGTDGLDKPRHDDDLAAP